MSAPEDNPADDVQPPRDPFLAGVLAERARAVKETRLDRVRTEGFTPGELELVERVCRLIRKNIERGPQT